MGVRVVWEHRLAPYAGQQQLQRLGDEGWQLAAFVPDDTFGPTAVYTRSRVVHERPPETEITKEVDEARKIAHFLAKRNLAGNEEYAIEEAKTLGRLVLGWIGDGP